MPVPGFSTLLTQSGCNLPVSGNRSCLQEPLLGGTAACRNRFFHLPRSAHTKLTRRVKKKDHISIDAVCLVSANGVWTSLLYAVLFVTNTITIGIPQEIFSPCSDSPVFFMFAPMLTAQCYPAEGRCQSLFCCVTRLRILAVLTARRGLSVYSFGPQLLSRCRLPWNR